MRLMRFSCTSMHSDAFSTRFYAFLSVSRRFPTFLCSRKISKSTLFEKMALIWHLRQIRLRRNARTLILFLSWFLQKLDFYDEKTSFHPVFWISTPVFRENTLFHLEPSEVYFKGIWCINKVSPC